MEVNFFIIRTVDKNSNFLELITAVNVKQAVILADGTMSIPLF